MAKPIQHQNEQNRPAGFQIRAPVGAFDRAAPRLDVTPVTWISGESLAQAFRHQRRPAVVVKDLLREG